MVMGKCHELTVDYSHLMGPTAVRLASKWSYYCMYSGFKCVASKVLFACCVRSSMAGGMKSVRSKTCCQFSVKDRNENACCIFSFSSRPNF